MILMIDTDSTENLIVLFYQTKLLYKLDLVVQAWGHLVKVALPLQTDGPTLPLYTLAHPSNSRREGQQRISSRKRSHVCWESHLGSREQ